MAQLSPKTVINRFHTSRQELSDRELDYLTCCDGQTHLALIAGQINPTGHHVEVGVARCIREDEHSSVGEVAIVIVDHWQGVGVGKAMFSALRKQCLAVGISEWKAMIRAENVAAIRLMEAFGDVISRTFSDGVFQLRISLVPPPVDQPVLGVDTQPAP
jgi:GNAT superfamily N-acetyltransferase